MSDRIAVMSGGRVAAGRHAGRDLRAAGDRFVADFIGETNFLDGEMQEVSAGHEAVVALDGGTTVELGVGQPAGSATGASAGERVAVAVRPEKVRMAPAFGPDGSTSGLRGRIAERLYVGADTSFVIRLDSGETVRVRRQNSDAGGPDAGPEPGAAVVVSWASESARLLTR